MTNPDIPDPRRGRSALAAFAAAPRAAPRPAPANPDTAAQTLTAMGNAAQWVRSAPMDLRDAAFERIAPMLSSFLPVELMERVRRAPKDDRSLDAFIGQIGETLQGLNPAGAPARAQVRRPAPARNAAVRRPAQPPVRAAEPQPRAAQPVPRPAAPAADPANPRFDFAERDLDAWARMVATEAIGEGEEGMTAAGYVALNRLGRRHGGARTMYDVVHAPHQFEGMTRAERVRATDYATARRIVEDIANGRRADPTGGAVNFINRDLQLRLGRRMPGWARRPGRRVGRHDFYAP